MFHGVAYYRPWQARMQEVERVFGRKNGVVFDVRWLLQPYKRGGKGFSSLGGFLSKTIGIAKRIGMKQSGQRHIVEECE